MHFLKVTILHQPSNLCFQVRLLVPHLPNHLSLSLSLPSLNFKVILSLFKLEEMEGGRERRRGHWLVKSSLCSLVLSTALKCPSTPGSPSASCLAGHAGVSSPAPAAWPERGVAGSSPSGVPFQQKVSGTHPEIAVCVCVCVCEKSL